MRISVFWIVKNFLLRNQSFANHIYLIYMYSTNPTFSQVGSIWHKFYCEGSHTNKDSWAAVAKNAPSNQHSPFMRHLGCQSNGLSPTKQVLPRWWRPFPGTNGSIFPWSGTSFRIYELDLVLNNLQELTCYKHYQPNNQQAVGC